MKILLQKIRMSLGEGIVQSIMWMIEIMIVFQ